MFGFRFRYLLSLLQYYNMHFSRLTPLGAMKMTVFEVHCRALNREPMVPLFRVFYILVHTGEWLTVEKKKPIPYFFTIPPDGMKGWKNRFFFVWLKSYIVPINMIYMEV